MAGADPNPKAAKLSQEALESFDVFKEEGVSEGFHNTAVRYGVCLLVL